MPAPGVGSLGELLVEFVCTEKDGRNRRASTYVGPFPSGAPGIFIDQAARQGARAVFAGAVGDDAFGGVVLDRLTEAGVSGALIRSVPGVPTGSAFVSYDTDGGRHFVFNMAHSAAARFPHGVEAVAGFVAGGVDVLHVSGSALGDPTMRARIFAVCTALHGRGVRLSIDPNVRHELIRDAGYVEVVRALIDRAAYVLPSDADAEFLFPGESFEAWSGRLLAAGAEVVALKRGADGAMARDAAETLSRPAFPAEVVDPTGAGDCFCATFVTLHAGGAPLGTALGRAAAAGALAVGRLGPMEGNSRPAAIDARIGAAA
jgi:sugar/nucleoside kinase (ribokinase family)